MRNPIELFFILAVNGFYILCNAMNEKTGAQSPVFIVN